MGFTSMDDFINEVTTNSKFFRSDWNKLTHAVTAHVAGEWHCLFHSTGGPTAATQFGVGTADFFTTLQDRDTGAILHGGDVSTDTKHLVNASAYSSNVTTMPAVLMLVDLLGFITLSGADVTTGASTVRNLQMGNSAVARGTTFTAANATDIITHASCAIETGSRIRMTNAGGALPAGLSAGTDYWTIKQSSTTSKLAATRADAVASTPVPINFTTDGTGTQTLYLLLPRYTDGKGVQAFLTPSTVMGAGTPNIQLTYTNTTPTSGKTTPTTLPIGKTASAIGHVSYSGTGAGKFGPFIPLAAADQGIVSVEGYSQSATWTSGVQNLVLCKPLLTLPMTTIGVAAERDCLNQVPSLPRIYDGACLAWLMYAGAATPVASSFNGHLDFAWG